MPTRPPRVKDGRRSATGRRPTRQAAPRPASSGWDRIFRADSRAFLARVLPPWLKERRWYGGKARGLRGVTLVDAVPLDGGEAGARYALVRARYRQGGDETYGVPLAFSWGDRAAALRADSSAAVVAPLRAGDRDGILHAADPDPAFARALLDAVVNGRRFPGPRGDVVTWTTGAFARAVAGVEALAPRPFSAEQSNTTIRFGDRLLLKLFRRLAPGPNPELEIGAFLTDVAKYPNAPPVLGGIEYRPRRGEAWSLGVLQTFVSNAEDAWGFTLSAVSRFLARAVAQGADGAALPLAPPSLLALADAPPSPVVRALAGPYLDAVALLGRRTAELHLALAGHPEHPDFAPEPYTPASQRAVVGAARALAKEVFGLLRRRRKGLGGEARGLADRVLAQETELAARWGWVLERPLTALRTRAHGDYHLGQVLWTGEDFMIIDFEGEPARSLADRRAKVSPLRDVAGMLRSFDYAAYQGLATRSASGAKQRGDVLAAAAWARAWQRTVSGAYLRAYLETARGAPFLPETREELAGLLELFVTEKAIYELSYELNNRPAWVGLPLQGIADRLAPAS